MQNRSGIHSLGANRNDNCRRLGAPSLPISPRCSAIEPGDAMDRVERAREDVANLLTALAGRDGRGRGRGVSNEVVLFQRDLVSQRDAIVSRPSQHMAGQGDRIIKTVVTAAMKNPAS